MPQSSKPASPPPSPQPSSAGKSATSRDADCSGDAREKERHGLLVGEEGTVDAAAVHAESVRFAQASNSREYLQRRLVVRLTEPPEFPEPARMLSGRQPDGRVVPEYHQRPKERLRRQYGRLVDFIHCPQHAMNFHGLS